MHLTLWHVSPTPKLKYLDPTRSKGRLGVVWLCSRSLIPWAIDHVCVRHRALPERLTVYRVRVRREKLLRTGLRGVWVSRLVVWVCGELPAVVEYRG